MKAHKKIPGNVPVNTSAPNAGIAVTPPFFPDFDADNYPPEKVNTYGPDVVEKIMDARGDRVLAAQDSNVVSWVVEGLVDTDGTLLTKKHLAKNPPKLVVRDGDGNEVNFFLTKQLSKHLEFVMKTVYGAHFGVEVKAKDDNPLAYWSRKLMPMLVCLCVLFIAWLIFYIGG